MRFLLLSAAFALLPAISFAATPSEQVESAAEQGKYTYVMFFRADDEATQNMSRTIETHVAGTGDKTTWVAVNIDDPKEAELVKRFDASRMPLPAAFGVAPNGAVTGVFQQKVNEEQLTAAILTPKYSDMVKALQSNKIAVVCLMPAADTPIPAAVTALKQDLAFEGKLHEVKAFATDSNEAVFFSRMHVDPNLAAPVVLMFTPPGRHVGTFQATVTHLELAGKLHNSGKCTCSKCQQKAKE